MSKSEPVRSELSRLFEACRTDLDYQILQSLAVKADLLWLCECGDTQAPGHACDNCGAEQPKESEE